MFRRRARDIGVRRFAQMPANRKNPGVHHTARQSRDREGALADSVAGMRSRPRRHPVAARIGASRPSTFMSRTLRRIVFLGACLSIAAAGQTVAQLKQQAEALKARGDAAGALALIAKASAADPRSEERRVGKECRSRWSP